MHTAGHFRLDINLPTSAIYPTVVPSYYSDVAPRRYTRLAGGLMNMYPLHSLKQATDLQCFRFFLGSMCLSNHFDTLATLRPDPHPPARSARQSPVVVKTPNDGDHRFSFCLSCHFVKCAFGAAFAKSRFEFITRVDRQT